MSIISALLIELIALIFKNGYSNNTLRYFASVVFVPVQMPFLWIYYKAFTQELPDSYAGNSIGFILIMIAAVIALNAIGTLLGNIIGRELEKAGVLKGKKKKNADK